MFAQQPQFNQPTSNRRPGFTLVELLVLVAMVGVLFCILMPALSAIRDRNNKAICLSNLRQLGLALMVYSNHAQGHLPNGNLPQTNDPEAGYPVLLALTESVKPPVFHCPSDSDPTPRVFDGTLDVNVPNSPRVSYDFYSIYWFPEDGPRWSQLTSPKGSAPLVWDLCGASPRNSYQNHGPNGGNVLFADGHAEWQQAKIWDGDNWPFPANLFYPGAGH